MKIPQIDNEIISYQMYRVEKLKDNVGEVEDVGFDNKIKLVIDNQARLEKYNIQSISNLLYKHEIK